SYMLSELWGEDRHRTKVARQDAKGIAILLRRIPGAPRRSLKSHPQLPAQLWSQAHHCVRQTQKHPKYLLAKKRQLNLLMGNHEINRTDGRERLLVLHRSLKRVHIRVAVPNIFIEDVACGYVQHPGTTQ